MTSTCSASCATEEQGEEKMKNFGSITQNEILVGSDKEDAEDGNTTKMDGSTAFGRAFQRIMKRKLPSSAIDEAMGPILSAHKQLLAKKLEADAEGQKARKESKKEKQALRERGHALPAPYCNAKEKELIKLATKGVVKLFNAVNRVQSVQEGTKATKGSEIKDVLKRSKSAFLEMLQDGNGSNPSMQKGLTNVKKEEVADRQPGWSALQDTFMLGKTKLKDWDKKQEKNDLGGVGDTSDDSGSE